MREDKDMERELKIEKKPLITDIEVDEKELEKWESLKSNLREIINSLPDELDPPGGDFDKFILLPSAFEETSDYLNEKDEKKQKELEELRKKLLLNLAFKELEVNAYNPVVDREEEKGTGQKFTVKYIANNRPGLYLCTDGSIFWLERKE